MKALYIILFFLGVCHSSFGRDHDHIMDIGLFRDVKVKKLKVSHAERGYKVWGDSVEIGTMYSDASYDIVVSGRKAAIYKGGTLLGSFDTIFIKPNSDDMAEFKIKSVIPSYREREYQGGLKIAAETPGNLLIINQVPLDYYLAGVIESESGSRQNLEYYKVQAIISRTYALKNKYKHIEEGFMLTDLVNCQVYKNKCRYNMKIHEAVAACDDVVIIDKNLELITASFYSNSGGQTANSEDVWNKPVPYLRSVKDPYSEGRLNYTWTKQIPKYKWLSYLENNFQYPIEDPTARQEALSFSQAYRKAFFVDPSYGIPLRDIRYAWRLKSTFFSVSVEGDQVVLSGRGFGHGVGLSQEGAMTMSTQNIAHEEIIKFYYNNVELIRYDLLQFYLNDIASY